MNPRDTQFEGFAELLFEELMNGTNMMRTIIWTREDEKELKALFARRAYDLAFHAIDNSRANDMEDWETKRIMPYVPDMTELPKEKG